MVFVGGVRQALSVDELPEHLHSGNSYIISGTRNLLEVPCLEVEALCLPCMRVEVGCEGWGCGMGCT